MRILVTGANGLLGQKLSLLLDGKEDIDLVATARSVQAIPLKRGTLQQLDITDKEDVTKVISEVQPEVVINTAAMTQVDQCETERERCWLSNVTAVAHLVESCERANAKLIHLSTDFIFDGREGPLKEDALPKPVNYYGESKLAGEKLVRESNIEWAIVRTVLVFGATAGHSRSNIVLWVKKSLEEGKTIQVVNDQWRTPTLAEDLAMGCYLVASKKATGVYHISGEEMMTPYDIAMATARFFGLDLSLVQPTDSSTFKQPAVRPLKTGFDISKARAVLGYAPRSFADGLAILASQIQK